MAELEVNGRRFRDLDGYNAAKRDAAVIDRMKERLDMTNVEDVKRMRDNIEAGRYRFETVIGDDFLDELDDLIDELKRTAGTEQSLKDKKDNKGKKEKKPKEIKRLEDYDDDMQREIMDAMNRSNRKRGLFIALMGLVAAVSIGYLIFYGSQYAKNDMRTDQLTELIDDKASGQEYSVTLSKEDKTRPPILKKYEALYQKNRRIVGWLKIEDTNIDYPVMQTTNNDYYLDHNYNQEYDKNGSIFLDKDCDPAFPNDNMIIYGHHMKSGRMFGNLNYYAKESYYKEHPVILFDTIYEEGQYEIMYVFRSKIYSEEEIVFKYYKFIDATSEDEFYSNMEEMEKLSLYDTGVTAEYGDKLITLSTCDNTENNGRFVVVAKKIK
ncbi:MAG: class B sortase [Lachnospiraceae bacterium]|nr:class B sortase [Lachnospiraceae bacterium]